MDIYSAILEQSEQQTKMQFLLILFFFKVPVG